MNFQEASLGLKHLCPLSHKALSGDFARYEFRDIRGVRNEVPSKEPFTDPLDFTVVEAWYYGGTQYVNYSSYFGVATKGLSSIKMQRPTRAGGFYVVRDFEVMRRLLQLNQAGGFCGAEISQFLLIALRLRV